MPNILAVARIVSQILRDMPTSGTAEIRTSVLAEIASHREAVSFKIKSGSGDQKRPARLAK